MKYITIKERNRVTTVVKKSKFIASIEHVKDEAEAEAFVKSIRKEFFDATHNVFAYTIGTNDEITRSSDDGEPSGTSGRPVLETIKNSNLKHCAVVVTRYFGGTLLGASGLVKAYSEATKESINTAQKVTVSLSRRIDFSVSYEKWNKIERHFATFPKLTSDISYAETVNVSAVIAVEDVIDFNESMKNLLMGEYSPVIFEATYKNM